MTLSPSPVCAENLVGASNRVSGHPKTRGRLTALISVLAGLLCGGALVSPAQTPNLSAAVPSRLTQPIDEAQRVTLAGTVHRLANPANDRGAADDNMPLERVHIVLKRSAEQEATLKQAISDMHTPGTASYHKWMTPDQFGQQFGPSDGDIQTLANWLATHGFRVTKVNAGKQSMEIAGTAGQFQATFHSQIHAYQVNGQMHYATSTDPQIPAAVAPVFGGFVSLNNFQVKSALKVNGKAQLDPTTHKVTPSWSEGTNGVYLILAPGDFAKQYDLNPLYTAGTTGTGQTIAIINEANISIPLVNQYRSLFGLSVNPPTVIIDGNDPGIDGLNNPDGPNYASTEAYLDVEQAGAVAPAAKIDLVIAGDTALENGLFLAAEHAVYGDVAPVLSMSFGGCEAAQGSSNAFINLLWEQAAAQGQTVMVSSGDNGAAGCDDDNSQEYAVFGQAVNGLGSTPWNVSVGGTDFYYSTYNSSSSAQITQLQSYWNFTPSNLTPTVSLLQVAPEQPWNDSQYGLNILNQYAEGYGTSIAGGSGGASNCATGSPAAGTGGSGGTCAGYPKPAWQTSLTPADSVRDLPDVSLFAANGSNYTFYPICASNGDCQSVTSGEVQITGIGGTSASAPAFAGIMALVNQKYGPQGQADYVLYPLAKQFPAAFHDVVNGTNSVPCASVTVFYGGYSYPPVDCIAVSSPATVTDPTFGTAVEGQIGTGGSPDYNAVAGYDRASGLGSIDANVLLADWASVTFTASTVTLNPSQTSFPHGTAITISGTVTPGTASGNVALMTTSTEPLNVSESTFAVSGGTYSASVNYLPGGTYNIYGIYGGDGTDGMSTSAKTSITVAAETSATALNAYNSPGSKLTSGSTLAYGTQILLTAIPGSVNASATTSTPTGTVTFLNGTTTIGTVQVNANGDASFNYSPSPSATPYSITARYSGDNSYGTSTSSAFTFTIALDTPLIGLSSGSQTGTAITAVSGKTTLTINVQNYANHANQASTGAAYVNSAAAPTGMVTLTGLPSGTLNFQLQPVTNPSTLFPQGTSTVALPSETPGSYTVTASYPGDSNYAATSANFSVTITSSSLLPTTTTASASVTSTTVTANTIVSATVTGSSGGGFPTGTLEIWAAGVELGLLDLPTSGSGFSVTETFSLNGYLLQGSNQLTLQYSGNSVYAPSFGTVTITNGGQASGPPTIVFTIPNYTTYDTSVFSVSATSNSTGAITYSLISGPASVTSGGSVTLTGVAGTVVIQATQVANGVYTAGTQNASFSVLAGSVWLGNGNSSLSKFDDLGAAVSSGSGFTGGGLTTVAGPLAMAFDNSGNIWVANTGSTGISEFTGAGVPKGSSPFTGGGIGNPKGVAVDGLGEVWVANSSSGSVTVLSNAGAAISPSTGYVSGAPTSPVGIAIDISGNVWIANSGTGGVTELIGGAAPVAPLATAVANKTTGARP